MYSGRPRLVLPTPQRCPRAPPSDLDKVANATLTAGRVSLCRALPRCRPSCCAPSRQSPECALPAPRTSGNRRPAHAHGPQTVAPRPFSPPYLLKRHCWQPLDPPAEVPGRDVASYVCPERLRTRQISPFRCVHADLFAFVDERGHLYHKSGFCFRRLCHTRCRGALQAGLGLYHREL